MSIKEWKYIQSAPAVKLAALLTVLSLFASACSTTKITFESNPIGANIYVTPMGSSVPKLVGQTPVQVMQDEMNRETWGSGPAYIEVQKEGYVTEKVLITELSRIHTVMRFNLLPATQFKEGREVDSIVEGVLQVQQLIKQKRYDEALTILKQMETKAPDVSVIYELQGAAYLAMNKIGEALVAYRLAIRYNPSNLDASRMKSYIESRYYGTRSPANEVGE